LLAWEKILVDKQDAEPTFAVAVVVVVVDGMALMVVETFHSLLFVRVLVVVSSSNH
jgi:hypothetical protein